MLIPVIDRRVALAAAQRAPELSSEPELEVLRRMAIPNMICLWYEESRLQAAPAGDEALLLHQVRVSATPC